jgi:hypothetical protein
VSTADQLITTTEEKEADVDGDFVHEAEFFSFQLSVEYSRTVARLGRLAPILRLAMYSVLVPSAL